MQVEDCGYGSAVSALLNAGASMGQRTPPSITHSTQWLRKHSTSQSGKCPKSAEAVLENRACTLKKSKKRGRDSDCHAQSENECGSPETKCCGLITLRPRKRVCTRRTSADPASENVPLLCENNSDQKVSTDDRWESVQRAELASPHRVLPNYPDAVKSLPPGARRRAVNTIFLMARTLNLELCTPALGILIMDRFFSSRRQLPSCRESVMLTAMICLNAAGKVADIDKGYCGSHGVMCMVREATPPLLRQPDHDSFAKYAAAIEREVLCSIDSTILACPCALQIVADFTDWHEENEPLWLRAAILCDVFSADSVSTLYTQTQIARAVINIICGISYFDIIKNPECSSQIDPSRPVTSHIVQSINMFVNSDRENIMWRDPYFGVRCRHSANPELGFFFANAVQLYFKYVATSPEFFNKL